MSLVGRIPTDVSTRTAIAICAIAFVSALARGFSGFGSALIFMRRRAASRRRAWSLQVLITTASRRRELVPAWRAAEGRREQWSSSRWSAMPIGTWFLNRLDPVTTRWIISCFVFALLLLLLSGWRYRGKDHPGAGHRHRRAVGLLQRTGADRRTADRRLLARPAASLGDRTRQHPVVFRRLRLLLGGELYPHGPDHGCHQVFAADRPGLRHRRSGAAHRCSGAPARRCSARSATSGWRPPPVIGVPVD